MNHWRTWTIVVCAAVIFCLSTPAKAKELGNAKITGKIQGQKTTLTSATIDTNMNLLEFYSGDTWAADNPSLIVFMFNKEQLTPGKTITVSKNQKLGTLCPHLHLRSGKGDVDIAISDYDMTIKCAKKRKRGFLPVTIEVSVPSEKTQLKGFFFLKKGLSEG